MHATANDLLLGYRNQVLICQSFRQDTIEAEDSKVSLPSFTGAICRACPVRLLKGVTCSTKSLQLEEDYYKFDELSARWIGATVDCGLSIADFLAHFRTGYQSTGGYPNQSIADIEAYLGRVEVTGPAVVLQVAFAEGFKLALEDKQQGVYPRPYYYS
jgi:hypothetical protein